jgi:hypothetical protein
MHIFYVIPSTRGHSWASCEFVWHRYPDGSLVTLGQVGQGYAQSAVDIKNHKHGAGPGSARLEYGKPDDCELWAVTGQRKGAENV